MPALAAIALADGESSPVTHTFAPVTTNGQKGQLANRAASIPRGYEGLTIEVVKPSSGTAAYRIIGSMTLPTVADVDGLDQVVRQNKLDFTLNMSQDSTEQDRKNARVLLKNLFSDATIATVIEKLEPLY
jgi:hypothetical protein